MNSHEELRLDEKFSICVQIAEVPSGSSIDNVPSLIVQQLKRKKCIVQVQKGPDRMCLARCLVIASTRVEKGSDSVEYKSIRDNTGTQREAARALLTKLGLVDRKMSIADIPAFAKVHIFYFYFLSLLIKFTRNLLTFEYACLAWITHAVYCSTMP